MTAVHLHLLVNHLPIFATLLAAPLLVLAVWRRDPAVLGGAVLVLVTGTVGAWVADQSGDRAEHAIEDLPGVEESYIEAHEDWSGYSLGTSTVAALAGIAALGLAIRRKESHPAAVAGVLALTILADASLVMTGLTGGKIRHTEVRADAKG